MPDSFSEAEIAGFRDADAADTRKLIAYLDAVSRTSVDEKRRSFDALALAGGSRVLDAGCGTGDDVRAIAELTGPSGKVVGIDASSAMIAEAHARGVPPNVEFQQASVEAIPFEDAAFDAARAERVFQHLEHPDRAAAELRRVVRAGGRLWAMDPDWKTLLLPQIEGDIADRIVRALTQHLANPRAGTTTQTLLRAANLTSVVATPMLSTPPLARAYELFLGPALDYALADGLVTSDEGAVWLRALLTAEQRGEFFCAVTAVATLATA